MLSQLRPSTVSNLDSTACVNLHHVEHREVKFGFTDLSMDKGFDLGQNMSLALTIFLLVFVSQLIQWVGQSVLLELVR